MAMTTTACDDGKGHSRKAQRDDNDGGRGAITTAHGVTTSTTTTMATAHTDDDAQWHAAQQRTARTMTSSPHQANRQRPPLPAQYRHSP